MVTPNVFDLQAALKQLDEPTPAQMMEAPEAHFKLTPEEEAEFYMQMKKQEDRALAEEQLLLTRFPDLHKKYKTLADGAVKQYGTQASSKGLWLEVLTSLQPYLTNNPKATEGQVEHKLQQACNDWSL